MKGKFRLFFLSLLIIVLGWVINLIWYKPFFIEFYFERLFIEQGIRHPELLTKTRMLEKYGYNNHNRLLNNISLEYRQETYDETTKAFEMLRSYKRNKLSNEEKLTHDVLDFYLEKMIFKQQFFQHEIPLNHLDGIQAALPVFLKESQIVENLEDAENYLSRISNISDKVYQYIQTIMLREDEDKPPVFVFEYMMDQIDCFLTATIENNLIYKDFKTKLEKAKLINHEAKSELLYDLKLEIGDNVYPAFKALKIKLEVERERASDFSGIWQFNDGDTYYDLLLSESLTIDTSLHDLEQFALIEIDRLHNKVAQILEIPESENIKESLEKFSASQLSPRDSETNLVKVFDNQVNEFLKQRKENTFTENIDIKEAAPFNANYKLVEYFPASLDNYKKASLYVSNYLLGFVPTHMLKGVVISEIFPGNHFMNEAFRHSKHLPSIRKVIGFNAYKNGWKYYILEQAERLALVNKKEEAVGCLQWQLLYAATALADLRIHQRMFTRQEAVNYVMETTGLSRPFILTYIDKVIVEPAESPAYLVGFDVFKKLDKYLFENDKGSINAKFFENSRQFASYGSLPIKFLPKVLLLHEAGRQKENKENYLVGKSSE